MQPAIGFQFPFAVWFPHLANQTSEMEFTGTITRLKLTAGMI